MNITFERQPCGKPALLRFALIVDADERAALTHPRFHNRAVVRDGKDRIVNLGGLLEPGGTFLTLRREETYDTLEQLMQMEAAWIANDLAAALSKPAGDIPKHAA